jgi:Tol biopolymer transport system component
MIIEDEVRGITMMQRRFMAPLFLLYLSLICSQVITAQNFDLSIDIEPRWSPDGQWISFISNRTGEADLWIMDRTGNNLKNLTSQINLHLYTPEYSWSPDSQALLLQLKQDQKPGIYTLSLDGTLISLTETLPIAGAVDPSWSPDGTRVAFLGFDYEWDVIGDIWVVKANGSQAEQLTFNDLMKYKLHWLPESNKILYVVNAEDSDIGGLYAVNPDSKKSQQILKDPMDISVSRSKDQIAFVIPALDHWENQIWMIWLLQSDQVTKTHIAYFFKPVGHLEWSLDDKNILFMLECEEEGNVGVWIAPIDGASIENVVDCDSGNTSPHWSPDDNFIVFESNRSGNYDIWLVDIQTKALINLTISNGKQ